MSKSQVLVSDTIVFAQEEIAALNSDDIEVLYLESNSREEFFKELKAGGKYANIKAIYRTNSSATRVGVFDAALIEALPASLKFIAHNGAGYDQVDVKAAKAKGIKVSHTPQAVDDATATCAMYLIIGALRQFSIAEVNARQGKFDKGLKIAHDPEGKTLGIVGMGGIGKALAKRAIAFDMKIQYYNRKEIDPSQLTEFPAGAVTYVPTLDKLLSTSDVVSLNLPLNANTRGSFGREQFNTMKKGSVLVNTARGGVVDEEALLEALENGQLSTAGLDVFPAEPTINPKLLANPNISILPHLGTFTMESQKKMELLVVDNIKSALATGKLLTEVPETK